jgi:hypothetical protein
MDYLSLIEFCNTDHQRKLIEASNSIGNVTEAARKLGINESTARRTVRDIKVRAAHSGTAPGQILGDTTPEGFLVERLTTEVNGEGEITRQWVKTTADDLHRVQMFEAYVEALQEDMKPYPPVKRPIRSVSKLANQFVITDYHLGCLAWGEETGEDWDLKIAEDLLIRWFRTAIHEAPKANTAYFLDLGDHEHFDSMAAVTPTAGNILDSDTRPQKLIRVMVRTTRQIIRMLLETHQNVIMIKSEGNHNPATSAAAREWLHAMYEDEPRIAIDRSPRPYNCHTWGKNMLASSHGHKLKFSELPLMFAAMFPEEWGATKFRYCETGHYHHYNEKEFSGMIVTQHQTLAAPDAYAARGGWLSDRSAHVKTYHKDTGLCGYQRITPEMC